MNRYPLSDVRLWCLIFALGAAAARADPKLTYALRVVPERGEWRIIAQAEGIDPKLADVGVFLPTWGGWLELGPRVVRSFSCDPPVRPVPGSPGQFRLVTPRKWDGRLTVRYVLTPAPVGSKELSACPLVLRRGDGFQLGFAQGSLVGLSEGPYELPADRTLYMQVPRGWTCVTGYGPAARDRLRVTLDRTYQNGVIACGIEPGVRRGTALETPVEVLQLGRGPDVAPALRDALVAGWKRFATQTGDLPLPRVTDVVLPIPSWGTHTPSGTHLGYELDERVQPGAPLHREYARSALHELAHSWNGTALRARDRSMEWFAEGFTEYLALTAVVGLGYADPAWLGRTLLAFRAELDANPVATKIPFATRRPHWRDDDHVEQLIYRKAPLIALSLDASLRRAGHAGVARMIGELIQIDHGNLDLPILIGWLERHGQAAWVARYLEGAELPDVAADLTDTGLKVESRPEPVAHVGLALAGGSKVAGSIVAVEPGSPAAKAGVRTGDQLYGIYPLRSLEADLADRTSSKYPWGHTLLEPARPVKLFLKRGAADVRVVLTPVAMAGGRRTTFTPTRPAPWSP